MLEFSVREDWPRGATDMLVMEHGQRRAGRAWPCLTVDQVELWISGTQEFPQEKGQVQLQCKPAASSLAAQLP